MAAGVGPGPAEARAHGIEREADPGQIRARALGARRRPDADGGVDGRPGRLRSAGPDRGAPTASPERMLAWRARRAGPDAPDRARARRERLRDVRRDHRPALAPRPRTRLRRRSRSCSMSSDRRSDAPSPRPDELGRLVRCARRAALLEALTEHVPDAEEHADATASYAFTAAVELGLRAGSRASSTRDVTRLHEIGLVYVPAEVASQAGERAYRRGGRGLSRATTRPATGSPAAPASPSGSAAGSLRQRERFDGGGPEGLAGEGIPIESRLMRAACACQTALVADEPGDARNPRRRAPRRRSTPPPGPSSTRRSSRRSRRCCSGRARRSDTPGGLESAPRCARRTRSRLEEKLAYLRELREQAVHSASEEAVDKQHAKGKLTARERVEKLLDPGSFEELDTFVRHRTYEFDMDKKRPYGDAVVTGYGTIDGRTGVRLQPGLHRLRRLAGRGDGGEDVQGHGPRRQGRRAGDRDQRLGRGADPGGRRLARRLRRRLRPQRPVLRGDPADQRDHGPVRGRRRLLAGDDRLHLHGQGDLAHVHHRPRGDQDGHRRGGRVRGAGRGDDPQLEVGRRPLRRRRRGAVPRRTSAT